MAAMRLGWLLPLLRSPADVAQLSTSKLRPSAAGFASVSEAALPTGLRRSRSVVVRLQPAQEQMQPMPSRRGEKAVGVSDRGSGLVYREGRPASSQALSSREEEIKDGVWVVKIQPPLDVSSDSAGGAGRITPATLLLNDKEWQFVRFVKEEDEGHFPLLRCALSENRQIAYRYAEQFEDDGPRLRVFLEVEPSPEHW
mmetsp:Transcript_15683/g.28535  ORF Transcript_15683/g.28535 Transcript_15683/m.28535 type:complete len:198 (+) Transcript_15683:50-643(+)